MKIPAIRAKIGTWTYYITTLTFEQVNKYVSKVDDELHKSEGLKELIQRSITSNYLSIKNYILNQPELFFNSLVLAVYNDYPNWQEIEIKYDGGQTYQVGLLDFPSTHKIFPVDGQHRVEGIKAALADNIGLKDERIGAIFIGHSNDSDGMTKTRRLFSTLNRYAKPVTMDDIIALDEDDSIAIVTRNLLEGHDLFTGKNVTKSKNKAIPNDDKDCFTSIITLYDCNWELLKYHRKKLKQEDPYPERDNKPMEEYLKFRPNENELAQYEAIAFEFWNNFSTSLHLINDYLNKSKNISHPAAEFRNQTSGGNLLFRPVGLYPFVQACIEIKRRTSKNFNSIFDRFNSIELKMNEIPWRQVIWNSFERTMIMGNQGLTKLLLMYLFDQSILRPNELSTLKNKYAGAINYTDENVDNVLDNISQ